MKTNINETIILSAGNRLIKKKVSSKAIALGFLRKNELFLEKAEEQARELMNNKKYIEMDVGEYEEVWNNKVDSFLFKNKKKDMADFLKNKKKKIIKKVRRKK